MRTFSKPGMTGALGGVSIIALCVPVAAIAQVPTVSQGEEAEGQTSAIVVTGRRDRTSLISRAVVRVERTGG